MSTVLSDQEIHDAHMRMSTAQPTVAPKAASKKNWCDVRTSYPVGKCFNTKKSAMGHSMDLTFTTNEDKTLRVVKLITDGVDTTSDAKKHGSESVALKYDRDHAYDCKKYDYYLGWKLQGEFVKYLKTQVPGLQQVDLYANYNKNPGKKYMYYKFKGLWTSSTVKACAC